MTYGRGFKIMIGIYLYRISNDLYKRGIPLAPQFFTYLIYLFCGGYIPYSAEIGKNSNFGYGGMGIVIHRKAKIGRNCLIAHQVTIGENKGVPMIGNNVYLATGSKILGGITIGNNVIVAANSVVINSNPDNCLVGGVPARIIRSNIDIMHYINQLWPVKFRDALKNGKIDL